MTATAAPDLRPGLADPVLDGQGIFRAVLRGMSFPGRVQRLPVAVDAPAPLNASAAAVLLALADLDAPVWLDDALRTDTVTGWLRFHCGCPLAGAPAEAAFAVTDGAPADLDAFAVGTPESPERSTTLVVQVPYLTEGTGRTLTGPGIRTEARLDAGGVPDTFWSAVRANARLFPQGVDVVLAAPEGLACLPRTTLVSE